MKSTPIATPASISRRSSPETAGSDTVTFGQVHALARGQRPAHLHPGADLLAHDLLDAQADRPVRQVDDLPRLHELGEAGPGDRQPAVRRPPRPRRGRASTSLPTAELDDVPRRSGPIRSFGPGTSWSTATSRPAALAAARTRSTVSACCVRAAVREVQPGDVHPRLDHPPEHLRLARSGPDRRDDLGRSDGAHAAEATPADGRRKKRPLLAQDLEKIWLTALDSRRKFAEAFTPDHGGLRHRTPDDSSGLAVTPSRAPQWGLAWMAHT